MNIIGINTLVYMDALRDGATQSELLGSIAELGVTLAEVRREYIAGDDEFNAIANAARINGLRLFYSVPESITVNGDVNPRFEEFLDEAQRMGASNVRFNQGDINNVDLEVLRRIDESSAAHGVTLTIENDQTPENGTFACTSASLDHIVSNGGKVGYTFDLGNWYWRDEDAVRAFDRLLPYITVFHLKNVNGATCDDHARRRRDRLEEDAATSTGNGAGLPGIPDSIGSTRRAAIHRTQCSQSSIALNPL